MIALASDSKIFCQSRATCPTSTPRLLRVLLKVLKKKKKRLAWMDSSQQLEGNHIIIQMILPSVCILQSHIITHIHTQVKLRSSHITASHHCDLHSLLLPVYLSSPSPLSPSPWLPHFFFSLLVQVKQLKHLQGVTLGPHAHPNAVSAGGRRQR